MDRHTLSSLASQGAFGIGRCVWRGIDKAFELLDTLDLLHTKDQGFLCSCQLIAKAQRSKNQESLSSKVVSACSTRVPVAVT
eukprot:4743299-Amphidinium_carterae.3